MFQAFFDKCSVGSSKFRGVGDLMSRLLVPAEQSVKEDLILKKEKETEIRDIDETSPEDTNKILVPAEKCQSQNLDHPSEETGEILHGSNDKNQCILPSLTDKQIG